LFYIDSLLVNNFRNYRQQQFYFHPRLNIISGANAQGKTNLLESIYYLSVTRSFRTNRDQELANWADSSFFIQGSFVKDDFKHKVQVGYQQNGQMKVSINGDAVSRYDHLQQFPVVVFSPDDLMIIRDGPATRRRFLNLQASRLNSAYFKELRAYQRVLLQRNHLLKEAKGRRIKDLLEPWDQSLINLGSNIINFRIATIKAMEQEAQIFFSMMTDFKETLKLDYSGLVKEGADLAGTRENFKKALLEKKDLELRRGASAVGPHLDDLRISISDHDSRKYSSQGQKRTAALALKMAEVSLFIRENGDCPIILLDDVFSEFDDARKVHLLNFLKENAGQCFISTATGLNDLFEKLNRDYKTFEIKQGCINDEKGRPFN
jgi:DNA replication and repair protein RecF